MNKTSNDISREKVNMSHVEIEPKKRTAVINMNNLISTKKSQEISIEHKLTNNTQTINKENAQFNNLVKDRLIISDTPEGHHQNEPISMVSRKFIRRRASF
jgi:hypothetical protein